ncbi:M24 family metallopeptidase [Segniliparus rugosus]|uniref:Peptidase M24 domain-containing protein n=1 Tax=Segniliparus rugosus (strain ATCC BAA-974 / DSM 45345 / CCUG 50838 / CIP 108380 / JCM 13579 / CDC 945) TaxID=679197 RepID=E5XPW7_SEGRC|nr:M24 family metallopeptidase [Segniliparus rugosus]EFV13618.1 hypothetical protein HMPREF9336_01539 [Segniliparus rugosus ATCC BAA-974]
MTATGANEQERRERLGDAQRKAAALFEAIETGRLIRPGLSETEASEAIKALAEAQFGVRQHWHKRIVRAGANTLSIANENPPERVLAEDDIVFIDLGPVFEAWEADFGRTYVLGDDPAKHRLANDLPEIFEESRAFFNASPQITGAQLYDFVVDRSRARGWDFAGQIAGHLIGEFPHKHLTKSELQWYAAPGSDLPMRRPDPSGRAAHWILEVHIKEPEGRYGGFYEELLDI